MQRIEKHEGSLVLVDNIEYIIDGNNSNLASILYSEQKGFCAYTETYLGRSDKAEIDHFNPSKNFLERNEYHNLFLSKARWNLEKSNKWKNFQPILHPTDLSFEERVIYDNGDYRAASEDDEQAKNLIKLLKLDDADLADERKRYINRRKDEILKYGTTALEFFQVLLEDDKNSIQFLRAIKVEFKVDIKILI